MRRALRVITRFGHLLIVASVIGFPTLPRGAALTGKILPAARLSSRWGGSVAAMTAPANSCGTMRDAETQVEVEKKLFMTLEQQRALLASFPSKASKAFTDVYYDGFQYSLTSRDLWLRRRDTTWELKVPWAPEQGLGNTQSYEEISTEDAILERLLARGLLGTETSSRDPHAVDHSAGVLEQVLANKGINPFAKLHTERVSLEVDLNTAMACGADSLHIDMDVVTFDPAFAEDLELHGAGQATAEAPFVIAEVEIMTPKQQELIDAATAALDKFLVSWGLCDARQAYSKLIEYLLRFRPAHLDALSVAGVIPAGKLAQLREGRLSVLR